MTFTLACVWVRGHRNYGPEYVGRLQSMVARHTTKPFEMVCITDRPGDLPKGVRPLVPIIARPKGMFAWWEKLWLFLFDRQLQGRILYLDLDTIITGDLDEIIDYPASFAISPCSAPNWQGKDGLVCVKGYNSSVMAWDAGCRPQFYDAWDSSVAGRLWSDQDWLKEISPSEITFPPEWFERIALGQVPKPETKVVLCIKHKNHRAAKTESWVAEAWR